MSDAVVTKERFLQRGNFCACQAIFSVLSSGSKTLRADRCFAWTVLDQPFVCRRLFTLIACVHNQILQGAVQYQLTLGIRDSTYILSEFTSLFKERFWDWSLHQKVQYEPPSNLFSLICLVSSNSSLWATHIYKKEAYSYCGGSRHNYNFLVPIINSAF